MSIDLAALRAQAGRNVAPRPQRAVPVVTETVRVVPVAAASHLLKPDTEWTPEDLRDYVMGQIEQWHGPQIRNAVKELAIFRGFINRWGIEKAVKIARVAFEVERGMWNRAPISVNRFCANSDEYFAKRIALNL